MPTKMTDTRTAAKKSMVIKVLALSLPVDILFPSFFEKIRISIDAASKGNTVYWV